MNSVGSDVFKMEGLLETFEIPIENLLKVLEEVKSSYDKCLELNKDEEYCYVYAMKILYILLILNPSI